VIVARGKSPAGRARAGDTTTDGAAAPTTGHDGLIRLQRAAGNAAVAGLLRPATVQRDKKKKPPPKKPASTDPPQKQLADIQGHAMDPLLTELAALEPEVRGDEALGLAVGGTRLVMAMQTVKAKTAKTAWTAFLASKKADFMEWPPDQVGAMLRFLGAKSESAAMEELAVVEMPEIVNNTQGDLPLVEKGRSDLIRTTAGEMTKHELGHRYTSLFIQDVRQRVLVALYMRATQQGTIVDKNVAKGFSYPDRKSDGTEGVDAKVNDAAASFWGARQGGKSTYSFPLSEAGKKNAYAAITALFTPHVEPKQRTLIHCDYLVSIIEYRAWAETIGIDKFNKNVEYGNIPLVLEYDGFAKLSKEIRVSDEKSATPMRPLEEVTVGSEADLVVGDHVVFYNHPTYDPLTEKDPDVWKLENAIVVGADKGGLLFQGHGYPTPVAKGVLMSAMCNKYNLHVDRALALIKAEQGAKGKAAKDSARMAREAKYPNVKRKPGGGWEVVGPSTVTERVERRDLGYLTPETAPGLRNPKSGGLAARRPTHG
jgi:hypothetical protein